MWHVRAAVFAALFLAGLASQAVAQDVTLRARDGAIELSGTLLGFDGEFYRLDTEYGELTIDGSGVLCDGPGCPSLTDFVAEIDISGSATAGQVLMPALLEGFARRNGMGADRRPIDDSHFTYELSRDGKIVGRFHFRLTTTDEGFADLLGGDADIAMALREIRREELARAREAGLGELDHPNRSRVLALDALIPVVAPGNPVDAISVADLARVVAGQIDNWRDLGGPDAPIAVHLRDPGSGLLQNVEDRLMAPARLEPQAGAVAHMTNEALAQAIVRDPFGIGIASFSEIGNAKPLTLTGPCGFSLRGTRRNIKTEDYPLTAPMFLYLPARRLPALGRDFLRYTRSDPAQIVIRRAGFVDQDPETIPINLQGDRLANAIAVATGDDGLTQLQDMMTTLGPMQRLSTSFRFEAGSVRLDAQSRSNVQQLARSIEGGAYDSRHMVFVGFSDGQGPAGANLAIARRRAEAVRRAVIDAAETADASKLDITSTAFGEAMPMACDDSAWGRQVNRRVEVWLR
ncbi:substrate-binding domain-containing protein [Aestuariicoccus sp. MJ-SS9]|uniref:substrate-binding domain-containing protein n=1 Tax=Aestuariicoccus sp. MJ-SS9 TaxID=3079855 RepID=UPI00290E9B55|nr:substrate-binding domain-containing protein [Aestuariicoccus sp. MJ-SS9]MDU8910201.1 substrate-binding domain-containing protein [Aestuariicoccus sp. MJ-SS9]